MAAQVRRLPLICSVLLGALVVSCARPPAYLVAPPAPAAAPAPVSVPAPQGGLQEPEPVQAAPPAPAVAPAPPPLAPAPITRPPSPVSGRPGGASSLVELSDAGTLNTWRNPQSQFCAQAGYPSLEPRCVHIQRNYFDQDGKPIQDGHKNCNDGTVNRPESAGEVDGKTYIKAGTTVTVDFTCESAEDNPDGKHQKSQTNSSEPQTGHSGGTGG
jgi:hypothetical protein